VNISLPGVLKNRDKFMCLELLEHLREVRQDPSRIGEFFALYVDEGFADWLKREHQTNKGDQP
jgi:hypothetical protein